MNHPGEEQTLREEIAKFESDLARIDANDDCAYEKARIRTYEVMLQDRRARLALLTAATAA
jgi:hypothetical protein